MTAFATVEEAWHVLQNGDDEHVRAEAIVFLGENRYAPSVPRLSHLVRHADPGTRYLAAKALGQIGDEAEAAVPTLLDALRDNDMFLRAGITGALIQIGPPAVPGLTQALFDPSNAVKRAACKALGKIGKTDVFWLPAGQSHDVYLKVMGYLVRKTGPMGQADRFHTDLIYYPDGVSLAYHPFSSCTVLWCLPYALGQFPTPLA